MRECCTLTVSETHLRSWEDQRSEYKLYEQNGLVFFTMRAFGFTVMLRARPALLSFELIVMGYGLVKMLLISKTRKCNSNQIQQ